MRALRVAVGPEQGERRGDGGQGPDRDESRANAAALLAAKTVRKEQSDAGAESGARGDDEAEFGKREVDSFLLHDGTSRQTNIGRAHAARLWTSKFSAKRKGRPSGRPGFEKDG